MNSKAQFAVFVIALAILGMFLMYIILVNPIERFDLLFGDTETTNGDTNGGTAEQTFYTDTVGLIGGASGQQIGTDHEFLDISVSQPQDSEGLYSEESLQLDSNIFISGSKNMAANNIDSETSGLELTFTLESKVGAPKVRVLLNNEIIYESGPSSGDYVLVEVAQSDLLEDNTVTLQCAYQGLAFWTIQSCVFSNVELNRIYYDNTDMEQIETMLLTEDEVDAPIMYVNMWLESSTTDGPLVIWLNDDKVYESAPTVGNDSFEVRNPNLTSSSTITFQSSEAGAYDITKVEFSFRSEVEPKQKKIINLPDNVAQQIRTSGKDVRFVLTVTDVDIPGKVYFFIRPTAYVHPVSVAEGTIFAVVENDEIDSSSNTITISSPNAKFTASQFKIIEQS